MSDQIEVKRQSESVQVPSVTGVAIDPPEIAPEQNKRTLKGMLMMAVCCAAPLLFLAAFPFVGITFGSGLLSVVALLACPIGMYGMYLMMRMMMKDKNIDSGMPLRQGIEVRNEQKNKER
ncbi:MAG: hypothetical protein Q8P24_08315 [Desulfobacterales bacterium]|nr:hypothetical protein [Desulfobacterales bacterium]